METFMLSGWADNIFYGVPRSANQLIISVYPDSLPFNIVTRTMTVRNSKRYTSFAVSCLYPDSPDIYVSNVKYFGGFYFLDLQSERGYEPAFSYVDSLGVAHNSPENPGKPNLEAGNYQFLVSIKGTTFNTTISNTTLASAIIDSELQMFDEETKRIPLNFSDLVRLSIIKWGQER